MSHSF
jgi:hypothetical protein